MLLATSNTKLNLPKLVFFSGRKGSGKSSLSNILVDAGYTRFSFADWLKQTVASVFSIEISKLYSTVEKEKVQEVPFVWNLDVAQKLRSCCNLDVWAAFPVEKHIYSVRELLQFVGTDILRKCNKNIHVEKTAEYIKLHSDEYLVCDDLRFENEYNLLKSFDGIGFFIIRPYNFQYSNHESETSLDRNNFDFILVNDRNEKKFLKGFKEGFSNVFRQDLPLSRKTLLDATKLTKNTDELAEKFGCSPDKIVWWCKRNFVPLSRGSAKYNYNSDCFTKITCESSYFAGLLAADGCIKPSGNSNAFCLEFGSTDLELVEKFKKFVGTNKDMYFKSATRESEYLQKDYYYLTVNDPYIVEDLKMWDMVPRYGEYKNTVPEIVKTDNKLFNAWLAGLIDGDGSIYYYGKKKSIGIGVIASTPVVDFISNKFSVSGIERNIKGVKNLDCVRFFGQNVTKFYNETYNGLGLPRKWDKLKGLSYLK